MPVVHVNDVDLYYEIYGEGFPLVLAHGYCTSINLWQHQIPFLSQRYRVIAYDARGHGLSGFAYSFAITSSAKRSICGNNSES